MGGPQEASGANHRGGVSPGVGTSSHHSGAVGATSTGDHRVEHGREAVDHQGGAVKGSALQEGPGEYPQVHSEGQGDEERCPRGGAAEHGNGGGQDDPTFGSSGVGKCEEAGRADRESWCGEEEVLGMHPHAYHCTKGP